jgi:hypothetical protein
LQNKEFRAGVEIVGIDPSAPFAAVLRDKARLPDAWLVIDHWHLHRLANPMLTRSASAPPANGSVTAAARHMTCGPSGGCCSATAAGSLAGSGLG